MSFARLPGNGSVGTKAQKTGPALRAHGETGRSQYLRSDSVDRWKLFSFWAADAVACTVGDDPLTASFKPEVKRTLQKGGQFPCTEAVVF